MSDSRLDRHAYQPDPQSGAGNCGALLDGKTCGRAEHHVFHPHSFVQADPRYLSKQRPDSMPVCVCSQPQWAECHVIPGVQMR